MDTNSSSPQSFSEPESSALLLEDSELLATTFAAITGGLCLWVFGVQPASITGALLQEGIHVALSFASTESLKAAAIHQKEPPYSISLIVIRFLVVLFTLALGTRLGLRLRNKSVYSSTAPAGIAALYLLALFLSEIFLVSAPSQELAYWQGVLCLIFFALAIGLLWGVMPEEYQTTARSSLLKKSALGKSISTKNRSLVYLFWFIAIVLTTVILTILLQEVTFKTPAFIMYFIFGGTIGASAGFRSAQLFMEQEKKSSTSQHREGENTSSLVLYTQNSQYSLTTGIDWGLILLITVLFFVSCFVFPNVRTHVGTGMLIEVP